MTQFLHPPMLAADGRVSRSSPPFPLSLQFGLLNCRVAAFTSTREESSTALWHNTTLSRVEVWKCHAIIQQTNQPTPAAPPI